MLQNALNIRHSDKITVKLYNINKNITIQLIKYQLKLNGSSTEPKLDKKLINVLSILKYEKDFLRTIYERTLQNKYYSNLYV